MSSRSKRFYLSCVLVALGLVIVIGEIFLLHLFRLGYEAFLRR